MREAYKLSIITLIRTPTKRFLKILLELSHYGSCSRICILFFLSSSYGIKTEDQTNLGKVYTHFQAKTAKKSTPFLSKERA